MKTLDHGAVLQALMNAGLGHAWPKRPLADAAYAPPRADWLLGEFDAWFRTCLARLGIVPYLPEAGDCDDYAALYSVLARVCHRMMPAPGGYALPIGELYYVAEGRGPHAINIAVTSDRGVIFIEPQLPGRTLNLTPAERSSAWLLKL